MANRSCLYAFLLPLLLTFQSTGVKGNADLPPTQCRRVVGTSGEMIQFGLNLIFLETYINLYGSTGKGIDAVAPDLVQGPAPIGARIANLDNVTRQIIEEFGYDGVGTIRDVLGNSLVQPIKLPLINLSIETFEAFCQAAFNDSNLRFNTYASTNSFLPVVLGVNYFLRSYFVGILPYIVNNDLQILATSILAQASARFGVLRAQLYLKMNETVTARPHPITVGTIIERLAEYINRVGMCGVKDEGLTIPLQYGAENRTTTNLIIGGVNNRAFSRTAREALRITYGTGNATSPGGYFPRGANGKIAQYIIRERLN